MFRTLHSRMWLSLAILVGVCLLGSMGGTATAGAPQSSNAHLKHIFVIMLENHSKGGVIGDSNTPYITSLAHTYGEAADYYGVTHPSEPNYVALVAGSNFGFNEDNPNLRYDAPNLADQLDAHGYSWATYEESLPYAGFTGDSYPSSANPLYASKHDPLVLFNDIRSNASRLQNIKPFTALATDLRDNRVPDFSLIVPNQCHDMHGGIYSTISTDGSDGSPCPYSDAPNDASDEALKAKADTWVHSTVDAIMHSKAWTGNSAIFIVADESDYSGAPDTQDNDYWADTSSCCDSPFLPAGYQFLGSTGLPDGNTWVGGVYGGGLSPAIVITTNGPRGYVSTTPYNHYSLLTTIEANWHLGYLGHAGDTAGGVVPMNDLLTHH
jgi:hypothetical protein